MNKMITVTLLALLAGGAFALPIQEAEAATRCYVRNGHRVCESVAKPRTVCTTTHGVRHCRRVY
jgi:hypothetical protein